MRFPSIVRALTLGAACSLPAGLALASGLDPFRTGAMVAPSRSAAMRDAVPGACDPAARPSGKLSLARSIEFALCNNPQTQRSWSSARAQAAQIGIAKATFLPSVNANSTVLREKSSTRVEEYPDLNRDVDSQLRTARLDLNLVLFDFGARSDNLENARQLLAAANASHDAALQTVFVETAQHFYDALTASSSARTIRISRKMAGETYLSSVARFKIGLGSLVEKLQAETAYSQETVRLVKAEGARRVALGNLAAAMGFPANTPVEIDEADQPAMPDTQFVKSVDALMEQAKQAHPSLVAARAQLAAARATEQAVRASAYPTLSFTANKTGANQPSSQLGLPQLTTRSRGAQVGLQLSIPLFDGFGRSYRARQAAAQAEMRSAELGEVELGVSLGVWKGYQALMTATEQLSVSDQFRASAAKTVDAAQARYGLGATDIFELLNARTILANAEQQQIQAQAEWRTARLRLAYSLGTLGTWALE